MSSKKSKSKPETSSSSSSSTSSSSKENAAPVATTTTAATTSTKRKAVVDVNFKGSSINVGFPILALTCNNEGFVACGGGGGGAKTGIRNSLILFRLRDIELEQLSRIDVDDSAINSVAFHPTKRFCAFGVGRNCRIVSFDSEKFQDVTSFQTDFHKVADESEQRMVLFSDDGSKLITAGSDGTVRLWDFPIGSGSKPVRQWQLDSPAQGLTSVNNSMVFAVTDNHLFGFRFDSDAMLAKLHSPESTKFRGCRTIDNKSIVTGHMRPASRKARGLSALTRWTIDVTAKELKLSVADARQTSDEHHVSLGQSADKQLIGLGTGGGSVTVCGSLSSLSLPSLAPIMRCPSLHGFVVTQVAFPESKSTDGRSLMITTSFDNSIIVTPIKVNVKMLGSNTLVALLLILILALAVIYFFYF